MAGDGERLVVVPYDSRWPGEFEAEARRIREALGALALRIDHHGSTAVPGLAAKPVIDIQVSVETLVPLESFGAPLESIGYAHLPHADDSFCPFFYRPREWPHSHHVHMVERGGAEERRTLAFRDYLREHPAVAAEYGALKIWLATTLEATGTEARETYARAKSAFVEQVIAMALEGGYPR
jgi:GrpB-like predicted nucleotidyltransferase (UPF0157 family)